MKIILVLFYLGFVSVQARPHAAFKPNPNLSRHHKFKIQTTPKPVLPDDRRKLPFFPKSPKKFVVSLDGKSTVPQDPIAIATKKPVMKKLAVHDRLPEEKKTRMEYEPRFPLMGRSASSFFENDPKTVTEEKYDLDSDEVSIELLQENFKDDEKGNDSHEDDKETEEKIENKPINSIPPEPIQKSNEFSITELLLDKSDDLKRTEENRKEDNYLADEKEYIFLTPEKEKAITEESDEFVTTEEATTMQRIKRSDNVIEEENLGTTLAGYKYTWRDTRLTNDLVFKNIHS